MRGGSFAEFAEVFDEVSELLLVEGGGEAVGHEGAAELDVGSVGFWDGCEGAGEVADGDGIGGIGVLEAGDDGAVFQGDGGGFVAFFDVEARPDDFGDDHVDGQAAGDGGEVGADLALGGTGHVAGDAAGLFVDFFALGGVAEGLGGFDDVGDVGLGVGGEGGVDAGEFHEERGEGVVAAADAVKGLEDEFGAGGGEGVGFLEGAFQSGRALFAIEEGLKHGDGLGGGFDGGEALEDEFRSGGGVDGDEGVEGGGVDGWVFDELEQRLGVAEGSDGRGAEG